MVKIKNVKKLIRHVRFALGGKSIQDKLNSFILRSAMENPFESRSKLVQNKIQKHGNVLSVRHKYFHNMRLDYDVTDNFEMAICREFFLDKAYDLSKVKFRPKCVIDCGAYRGYFSFLASKTYNNPEVISIEANPDSYYKMKNTISVNAMDNIQALNKAVSAKKEKVHLVFDSSNSIIKENSTQDADNVEVETIDLYNLIDKDDLLLKVDIEGAELDFFPEIIARLPRRCAIFLEVHTGWESLSEIKKAFLEQDFEFEIINERGDFIDIFAQRIHS